MNPVALTEINWPQINQKGLELISECVIREHNTICGNYGVPTLSVAVTVRPDSRYKIKSSDDVLGSGAVKWRIKGVLPEQGVAALYGPSGSGKSFLVMDMAINIAKGAKWFGYRVKSCPVVYICLEGEAGLSVRLAANRAAGSLPKQLAFIDQPLSLLDSKDIKDLVIAIKNSGSDTGVVIIDTLNRAAPGMDENSSVDMGHVINAAKLIQQGLGCLVLLVHHSGKDVAKGMRGHSSLYAALDAVIEVKRTSDSRAWSVAKAKDGADGNSHAFVLDVVRLGTDEDGDPITSCVVRSVVSSAAKTLTPSQRVGMESFMAAASSNIGKGDGRLYVGIDEWRKEFYSRSVGDNLDSKRRSFVRVREQLVALGSLVVEDGVYRVPMDFPDLSDHRDNKDKCETFP